MIPLNKVLNVSHGKSVLKGYVVLLWNDSRVTSEFPQEQRNKSFPMGINLMGHGHKNTICDLPDVEFELANQ